MWRSIAPAALLLVALAQPAQPARAGELTWIGIGGPQDWAPRPGYTLEVGRDAWRIDAINGGGVLSLPLASRAIVRVRRLSDCVPVVRFTAVPGRSYFIRFAASGTARVEDLTGQGMDSGPALGDPSPRVCPALPDTSTADRTPASRGLLPILAAAAAIATVIAVLRRPAGRRPR